MIRRGWHILGLAGLLLCTVCLTGCGNDRDKTPVANDAGAGGSAGAGGQEAGGQEVGGQAGAGGKSTGTRGLPVLKALGVDTDIGKRTDPSGGEVSDNYNPVLKPITQLAKRSEIFAAGIVGQASNASWTKPTTEGTTSASPAYHHVALDWADGATDFTSANLRGDDAWATLPKAVASGDVDGDGKDEIFVAYVTDSTTTGKKNLGYRIIKRSSSGAFETVFDDVLVDSFPAEYLNQDYESTASIDYHLWHNYLTATAADLDGNGQSEMVVTIGGTLLLFGDDSRKYVRLPAPDAYDTDKTRTLLKVAAGDINLDGRDELVVSEGEVILTNRYSGTATYHIFEGLSMHEVDSGTIAATNKDGSTSTLRAASCAIGDLDADGQNEVLFVGSKSDDTAATYSLLVLEPVKDGETGKFSYRFSATIGQVTARDPLRPGPMLAIADFDGDGKKDILAYRKIFHNLKKTGGVFTEMAGVDLYTACAGLGSHYDGSLAVGDIDGDMKSDVIMVTDGSEELCAQGFNSAWKWVRKGSGDITGDSYKSFPAVTAGDFDGDSIAVEFLGSELLFSDPHPIAVLASNPFWSDISMDGGTSFGTGTETEKNSETSLGFSVGVSFGYESEGLFGMWSASIKASFESSFDWTASNSVAYSESYSHETHNEDLVVFTTVPYDVYYYKVLQAPDPTLVGTKLTVNLPRKPITMPLERTFYNSHNGVAPDIDESVLGHTVGNPLSYPSKSDAEALIASGYGEGLISKKVMTVGEGSNSSTIELGKTSSSGSSFAFDIGVTIEAEAGAGGFTMGTSAGFHYGETYGISTSDSAVYSGEVSSISEKDFSPDKSFDFGLFTYRGKVGSDKFVVVQYYTAANL